jgi:hypothetical protein
MYLYRPKKKGKYKTKRIILPTGLVPGVYSATKEFVSGVKPRSALKA